MSISHPLVWLLAASAGIALPARAGDLAATLEITGPQVRLVASSVAEKAGPGPPIRRVLTTKPEEALTIRWTLRNTGKTTVEGVLVHFFIVREERVGQTEVPPLRPDKVVLEGALTADFVPGHAASGTLSVRLPAPGNYLARVEAREAEAALTQPAVAAMDLEAR